MAHGEFSHIEIPWDDEERAKRFYSGVFGWEFSSMGDFPDYDLYRTGTIGGGLGRRGVTAGEGVRNYIDVDDIDASIAKVRELGGAINEGKTEIPGQGWYAVGTDSEGNPLALYQSLPR
jgi:uncharacterized protein